MVYANVDCLMFKIIKANAKKYTHYNFCIKL